MVRQIELLRFAYKLMLAGSRKEKIDQAKADLFYGAVERAQQQGEVELDNCKIRSPVTGTILKQETRKRATSSTRSPSAAR